MTKGVSFHPLTPLTFLERSADVYPDKPAVVHGDLISSYSDLRHRVNKLAGALRSVGVEKGDRVAFLVPNIPPMLEGHYGPMRLGAVLVAINIRLSPREVGHILNHSGAKVLIFDSEFAPTVREALQEAKAVSTLVQVLDAAPRA